MFERLVTMWKPIAVSLCLAGWMATAAHPALGQAKTGRALRKAQLEETRRLLPDWLKPLHYNGWTATVNDSGEVVRIHAGSVTTDELLSQLKHLPQLRELHLSLTQSVTPAGLQHLAELKRLEKLQLYNMNQRAKGLGDVAIRAVRDIPSLRELSITECGTTDAGVKLLEAMPQLTHLKLQDGRLTDLALASIATLKRLRKLDLTSYLASEQHGYMRFTAGGTRHLSGLKELEVLSLVGHAVAPEVLVFPQLKSLHLSGAAVDDAAARRIAQLRNLESLMLRHTRITDEGLSRVVAAQSIHRLDLASQFITDAGIAHLRRLPRLQHLSLRAPLLTDESLRHLAEIRTLSRLDLSGGRQHGSFLGKCFTIHGVRQLQGLPGLRTLDLTQWGAGIAGEELNAIRDALPDISILRRSCRGMFGAPIGSDSPKNSSK